MSEPTYTLTLTESERTALAKVLGSLVTKLINAPIFVESPTGGTAAARAVLSSPPQDSPALPSGHVPPPLPQARDRWASDRKIKAPQDAGIFWAQQNAVAREVTIWKTEQKPKKTGTGNFLNVTWQSHDRRYIDAKCFDSALFPWLIQQTGNKTTIYLVKSGQYLNIVGVRA